MKKVLLVEDDMIICMLNKKYITSLGYEVTAMARNADEAIKAVTEHQPDYILMDVKLKDGMDGIDAMNEIAKISDARVIYVTGSSDKETMRRAKQTNMAGFLTKPISYEMLKEILEK